MLKFDKNFNPDIGKSEKIFPNIERITAPNASPFTFKGTNSYIVGNGQIAIIDPGPNDKEHFLAILKAIRGRKLKAILLTHTHKDHSNLAAKLSNKTKAPILFGGKHRLSRNKRLFEINLLKKSCDWNLVPDKTLTDGDIIKIGGLKIRAIATAGHCANHFCFGLENTPLLFSGDHIMGWNSSLIAPPDGDLGEYLLSLKKLLKQNWNIFLPAHGGEIKQAKKYTEQILAHREYRNQQILALLRDKYLTLRELVDIIYPSHKGRLRFAASLTLKAHLEYLLKKGKITSQLSLKGVKYSG